MAQTQAERRNSTRSAILKAARDLFGGRGFAQVSIDDVAGGAGVTKGAIYHHFSSKEALFEAVLVAEQTHLMAQAAPDGEGELEYRLAAALRSYLTAAARAPTRQIVLVDGPAVVGWARWRQIDEDMFGQSLRRAVAALRVRDTDAGQVEALTTLIMGAVTEAALACASAADPATAAQRLSDALLLMLQGIAHTR